MQNFVNGFAAWRGAELSALKPIKITKLKIYKNMSNEVQKFCEEIINGIGGFKTWEDREFVFHADRDKAIVEWTIRCLATKNPLSEIVLNQINEQTTLLY